MVPGIYHIASLIEVCLVFARCGNRQVTVVSTCRLTKLLHAWMDEDLTSHSVGFPIYQFEAEIFSGEMHAFRLTHDYAQTGIATLL